MSRGFGIVSIVSDNSIIVVTLGVFVGAFGMTSNTGDDSKISLLMEYWMEVTEISIFIEYVLG